MMWGAAGQCICYIFISGLLSQSNDPKNGPQYGAGATAFFFLYYVFFGICWQVSFFFAFRTVLFFFFFWETISKKNLA